MSRAATDTLTTSTRPTETWGPWSLPPGHVVSGLLTGSALGTSAGVRVCFSVVAASSEVTGDRATGPIRNLDREPAEEVADLRDRLVALGLSRQDIARGVGVDRRSLSGWVSGAIRPTRERLMVLRLLTHVAVDIDKRHPGRVAEVLLHRRGDGDLLDQLARGRADLFEDWRSWLARSGNRVTVTHRAEAGEAIWSAADRARAEGRLPQPVRRGIVRSEASDHMDLEEAGAFAEPPVEGPRRRGYR